MKVNLWADFEKYEKVPDTLEETPLKDIDITVCSSFFNTFSLNLVLIYIKGSLWICRFPR